MRDLDQDKHRTDTGVYHKMRHWNSVHKKTCTTRERTWESFFSFLEIKLCIFPLRYLLHRTNKCRFVNITTCKKSETIFNL